MDKITKEQRSKTMSKIGSKDTKPEKLLRRSLHKRGFRYKLHDPGLPGKPDMVFPARKKIIFIHGCFWHGHAGKRCFRAPKSNVRYWTNKISSNRQRDAEHVKALKGRGYRVLVVWECELRKLDVAMSKVIKFLESERGKG